MTSNDKHQKHVSLTKPQHSHFTRSELAILGTSCGLIQQLVNNISVRLSPSFSLAYVDKEHKKEGQEEKALPLLELTEKETYTRLDFPGFLSAFERRTVFNKQDLVLVNGNHFAAASQIVIIDPAKDLGKKMDRLTDVRLILLKETGVSIPEIIKEKLPQGLNTPVFHLAETEKITDWIKNWYKENVPSVKGLVLAGGASTRMQQDKGALEYRGKSQREHVMSLMRSYCSSVFLSCNARQADELQGRFDVIEDVFLKLGPMGGILSAFREDPNAAWMTVACDLPYLSEKTLQYLVAHRNPSKVATAFLDAEGVFPEPLVTIWEPRAYPILLDYLSQGYSCPRKVLINTGIETLVAPDIKELCNVNYPQEYEKVIKDLASGGGSKA